MLGLVLNVNGESQFLKYLNPKLMDVVVHRAGKAFYPHSVTLLNQPGRALNSFLEISRVGRKMQLPLT